MFVEVQIAGGTPNSPSKHSPLRRVSAVASANPPPTQQTLSGKERTTAGNRLLVESRDSCYSSCSEESHCSLSREPSDSIVDEIAQLSTGDTGTESAANGTESGQQQTLRRNIDFATRLGYSVEQLQAVLEKLGTNAGQDQILSELIKLGRGTMERSSEELESSCMPDTGQSAQLRSIVIDGSNIAMTHGRKEVFSCRGIRECVQFFRDRGHSDIIVFVPQFRREAARSDCPITDQHILFELESENILVWTPSRRINGRRIVCHDDRYILKTAQEKDAVIVSNDEYRDLIRENPQYRMLVDERLLMYSFVDGRFMPPDDPLGRHGPKLAQFLSKGSQASSSQLCPYARKCTYGNKCKYYHPERPNGIRVSVTDRLMKEKQRKQCLSTRASPPAARANAQGRADHPAIVRTQSLNIPTSEKAKFPCGDKKGTRASPLSPHQEEQTQPTVPQLSISTTGTTTTVSSAAKLRPALAQVHTSLDRQYSAPSNRCSHPATASQLPSAPIIGCNVPAAGIAHYCYSRCAAAPPPYFPSPYIQLPFFTGNDQCPGIYQNPAVQQFLVTNANTMNDTYGLQSRPSHLFAPSATIVWSEPEPFVGHLARPTSELAYSVPVNERFRLRNVLCQLFPEQAVRAVMEAHPNENDPQKLCAHIITEL